MRDSRAFVIAEDKVEEFLNEKPDEDAMRKIYTTADALERWQKNHKQKKRDDAEEGKENE